MGQTANRDVEPEQTRDVRSTLMETNTGSQADCPAGAYSQGGLCEGRVRRAPRAEVDGPLEQGGQRGRGVQNSRQCRARLHRQAVRAWTCLLQVVELRTWRHRWYRPRTRGCLLSRGAFPPRWPASAREAHFVKQRDLHSSLCLPLHSCYTDTDLGPGYTWFVSRAVYTILKVIHEIWKNTFRHGTSWYDYCNQLRTQHKNGVGIKGFLKPLLCPELTEQRE